MDLDDDRETNSPTFFHHKIKYSVNNKVMVTAIISLSSIVVLVTLLHIYVRCVLRRQSRRRAVHRQLNLYLTPNDPPKTGLDPAVIASLPIFIFNKNECPPITECAVCLSVVEDDELLRVLPNCKHNFHADCIDKWLTTNSTCPICRTEAEPPLVVDSGESAARVPPTAPPLERVNSTSTVASTAEGTSEGAVQSMGKAIGSSSWRLSSFRKMLSRERSSGRIQSCTQEDYLEDLERQ